MTKEKETLAGRSRDWATAHPKIDHPWKLAWWGLSEQPVRFNQSPALFPCNYDGFGTLRRKTQSVGRETQYSTAILRGKSLTTQKTRMRIIIPLLWDSRLPLVTPAPRSHLDQMIYGTKYPTTRLLSVQHLRFPVTRASTPPSTLAATRTMSPWWPSGPHLYLRLTIRRGQGPLVLSHGQGRVATKGTLHSPPF